ncbi:hypothetical protein JCM11251_000275 [Rhodosporidiobolus azoricus]
MGIGGLLPLLKEIQKTAHVMDWKGKTVAVDSYVWLHRGAYGCAEDLALGRPTTKYVNYAMHRVRMLKYYGVTPIMVFDGGLLPSKMGTEDERERRRSEALVKGRALMAEGKASQARECFVKAVDVTPAMAYQLIKALRREGVQYVVAPYEADPQLCYLEKAGIVDAIITEDSDLLVFGCKNVLFKLDGEGNCISISRDDFSRCREYNLAAWSDAEFRQMAILSGCDYLDSVSGLGLKTAYRLMRKYKTPEKVIQFVRLEGQLSVPRNYLDEFRRAELTFLHQHVFDPIERKLVHLHPLPAGKTVEDLPFIGPLLEHEYACGLADGEIDPISKQPIVDLVPDLELPSTSKPCNIEPFRPVASSSKGGKRSAAPVHGAGSIRSFFAPKPSSSSTAVNPVRAVANIRRVHLLETKGKGKENEEDILPGKASRFFGGGDSKDKGRASAAEPEPEAEEYEQEPEEDDGEEFEAAAALREVEMQVEVRSVAGPASASSASTEDSTGADGVIFDITNLSQAPPRPAVPAHPSPPTPTHSRSSLPKSCLPSFISSPNTPPARKRAKHSHPSSPSLRDGDEDDQKPAPNLCSDAGISSPAESTKADAGWAEEEEEGSLSSPVAGPSRVNKAAVKPVKVKAIDVKPGIDSKVRGRLAGAAAATIELSSDPIVLSSDAPDAVDLEEGEQERTPRPTTKAKGKSPQKRGKQPAQSSGGKKKPKLERERRGSGAVRAREDDIPVEVKLESARRVGQSGKKKKEKEIKVEKEVEEVDEAVKSVAASWRAKFMMPSAASTTPTTKSTAFSRSLLPTPNTTTRPPSFGKRPAASSPPKQTMAGRSMSPVTTTLNRRVPLSPKSSNRIDRHSISRNLTGKRNVSASSSSQEEHEREASLSPARRRRSSLLADVSTAKAPVDPATAAGSFSSSPVVITNPRLLAFKFSGTVYKRD